jgi:hypothetical protein
MRINRRVKEIKLPKLKHNTRLSLSKSRNREGREGGSRESKRKITQKESLRLSKVTERRPMKI